MHSPLNDIPAHYFQIPYEKMDCAQFCEHLLNNHFGIVCELPKRQNNCLRDRTRIIEENKDTYAARVVNPISGDVCMMRTRQNTLHMGIYLDDETVIHSSFEFKYPMRHHLRDIIRKYKVEGYYRVRDQSIHTDKA